MKVETSSSFKSLQYNKDAFSKPSISCPEVKWTGGSPDGAVGERAVGGGT